MKFEVVGEIEQIETIAAGRRVKVPRQTMKRAAKPFAVCLENAGNEASLILGKVYRILPDARAAKDGLVRIVDESEDDYLFDKRQFAFVDFPQAVRKKIRALHTRPATALEPTPARSRGRRGRSRNVARLRSCLPW